jgi:opacity protein-like surface antigen
MITSAFAGLSGWSAAGETNPIRMGYDFGADLIVNLTPRIGLGFGAGYIQGTKESGITFTQGSDKIAMTSKPNIRAIPLRAGLFLNLPMGERAYFNLNVGAGYYLSKYSYEWKIEGMSFGGTVYDKITQEVTANGFGFHGGIGLEFDLTSNLAFFIEGQARYAKIGGFEGTAKEDSVDGSEQEEGKLYYYELQFDTDYNFKQVFIRQTKPSDPEIINVREAKVDFSGLYAVAGIRIKF